VNSVAACLVRAFMVVTATLATFTSFDVFGREQIAPELMLANRWREDLDVRDYWVSEKLDGVRAYWDGKEMRFRSGRPVPAPEWFLRQLPSEPLDGELWLGRDRFDELSAIVRSESPDDERWRAVRYMVFDLPQAGGDFTQRVGRMAQLLALEGRVSRVEQRRIESRKELGEWFASVLAIKGEGLMLHRADAAYRAGRSDDLLKFKPLEDAEATVIGYQLGQGRLAGVVGALIMRMPSSLGGHRFKIGVGLSDEVRRNPPPLGSVVTYRYTSLTPAGRPRFPRYWRVRNDP
jgi:DNA ligase-1